MVKPKVFKFGSKKVATSNGSRIATDKWVVVGKVVKAIALKGWVRVNLMTDNPNRFSDNAVVSALHKGGEIEPLKILESKEHFSGTRLDVLFEGIDDCDQATCLISCLLVIPKSERAKLPKGSFYDDELKGMTVIFDGKDVGCVLSLESNIPCPYISIDAGKLGEVLVPYRKEFIKNIDRLTRKVLLKQDISFHIPSS